MARKAAILVFSLSGFPFVPKDGPKQDPAVLVYPAFPPPPSRHRSCSPTAISPYPFLKTHVTHRVSLETDADTELPARIVVYNLESACEFSCILPLKWAARNI